MAMMPPSTTSNLRSDQQGDGDEPGQEPTISTPPRHEDGMDGDKQVRAEFQAYYLRKITAEFSDELDALRSAKDFDATSLPLLVSTLQQGASIFSISEQRRVLGPTKTREPKDAVL